MNLGGPAYHVSLLTLGLDAERYRTQLLHGAVGPGEASLEELINRPGVQAERLPSLGPAIDPRRDLRVLVALVRMIRRSRPHVIHTHTAKAGLLGRVAAVLALGRRPVVVHTYHGHVLRGYFGPSASELYRRVEQALGKVSDALVCVSLANRDELVELRVAPAGKFRVIPLGLELDDFLALESQPAARSRLELPIERDDVVATFVGRLVPVKRVEMLLHAIALARAGDTRIKLLVVGDGEMRAGLTALSRNLGLDGAVHFLGYRRDLVDIAAATDVAVLTSVTEGTPVSLIQAAAAARPVVSTAVGGVGEVVPEGAGILVEDGDVNGFAEALVRFASDREERWEAGRQGREHVRVRFDSRRLVVDIEDLYDSLLRARSTPAG